jgi:(1->4)-alpha-D-glucan 1-alpha-D-glucosylmutase
MDSEPIATYRIQLSERFGFDQLVNELDYLRDLGVSHVYASPILQAAPSSVHGYDVVDCGRISEDLGGEAGFRRLSLELQSRGLSLLLDIVPNHMSIDSDENVWWQDVLENGPASRHAAFFDIAWDPGGKPNGKILAPILPDRYGRALESGTMRLESANGRLHLSCLGRRMPLSPESVGALLREAAIRQPSEELDFFGRALQDLPKPRLDERESIDRRDRDKRLVYRSIEGLLADRQDLKEAITAVAASINGDLQRLDEVLQAQYYRLAYWRVASQQLGYRRFFDVNTLVALRTELREVFEETHGTLLKLFRAGHIQGIRVDHVDGLYNPRDYLHRLRSGAPEAWIVVEKILHPDEHLPSDWPVEGTTGYDFSFEIGSLFVDRSAERAFTDLYEEVTGERRLFHETAVACKRLVLQDLFGSDLRRLLAMLERLCEIDPRRRDYLETELQEALELFIAALPVYRTYIDSEGRILSDADRRYVLDAVEEAKRSSSEIDPQLFDLLRDLILQASSRAESDFVMRLQQLSGAATAKGIEDTAFYRYHRLSALNEVGGDPGRFGVSVKDFHERAQRRRLHSPYSMLATSTHDAKRSEDIRLRLCALTEIPDRWAETVRRWFALNEPHRINGLPDRKTEYLFYQTIVGAWPLKEDRAVAYMSKAAREAKEYTSWRRPDSRYEEALRTFVKRSLGDHRFRDEVQRFVQELLPFARIDSLSQTLIKLTAPGVPDFYQGAELWNLHLVDPDNRGRVDYELRRRLLREMDTLSPQEILDRAGQGLPKLWLVRQGLALRSERAAAFGPEGAYCPLPIEGEFTDCLVAFLRGGEIATLAPRLPRKVCSGWGETLVELPDGLWRCRLSGNRTPGGRQPVGLLLRDFPAGLYAREAPG